MSDLWPSDQRLPDGRLIGGMEVFERWPCAPPADLVQTDDGWSVVIDQQPEESGAQATLSLAVTKTHLKFGARELKLTDIANLRVDYQFSRAGQVVSGSILVTTHDDWQLAIPARGTMLISPDGLCFSPGHLRWFLEEIHAAALAANGNPTRKTTPLSPLSPPPIPGVGRPRTDDAAVVTEEPETGSWWTQLQREALRSYSKEELGLGAFVVWSSALVPIVWLVSWLNAWGTLGWLLMFTVLMLYICVPWLGFLALMGGQRNLVLMTDEQKLGIRQMIYADLLEVSPAEPADVDYSPTGMVCKMNKGPLIPTRVRATQFVVANDKMEVPWTSVQRVEIHFETSAVRLGEPTLASLMIHTADRKIRLASGILVSKQGQPLPAMAELNWLRWTLEDLRRRSLDLGDAQLVPKELKELARVPEQQEQGNPAS